MGRTVDTMRVKPQEEPSATTQEYINNSTKPIGIGSSLVQPGETVPLDSETASKIGVIKLIESGKLAKYTSSFSVPRCLKYGRPMRVMIYTHTLFRGGAENVLVTVARGLKELGVRLGCVVVCATDYPFNSMLEPEMKESCEYYKGIASTDITARNKIIRDTYNEFKPDVVLYSILKEVPNVIKKEQFPCPVINIQQSELDDTLAGYVQDKVDKIITVSHHMARNNGSKLNVPLDSIASIPNGIDPAFITSGKSMRKQLGIPSTATVIGFVGNLNWLKRPLFLFEIFRLLEDNTLHLVYAGNSAELGNRLSGMIKEAGLDKRVHVLGLLPDVRNVYKTIDMLVNCSETEGLPLTIIEAMHNGIPVIASNVGGNSELVVHNSTGFLFGKDDADSLASHINTLATNKELGTRMGLAGKSRAKTHFNYQTMAKGYLGVLESYVTSTERMECSIVMPAYNAEKTIEESIKSIMSQTFPHFEVIIVDDGSTDKTREIVQRYEGIDDRISYYYKPHSNIVDTLNLGIQKAKCPIIVRMDADDVMYNSRIAVQMSYLKANPKVDIVGSQMLITDQNGVSTGNSTNLPLTHDKIVAFLTEGNPMAHPTTMFRRKVWDDVGGYKGDGRAEDLRFWMDAHLAGFRFANLDVCLLRYRTSHSHDPNYRAWVNSGADQWREEYVRQLAKK